MTILYEDKFCAIMEDRVVLKLYYFPYGDRVILFKDVEKIQIVDVKNLGLLNVKSWGLAVRRR
jgi:hypothetical protein